MEYAGDCFEEGSVHEEVINPGGSSIAKKPLSDTLSMRNVYRSFRPELSEFFLVPCALFVSLALGG